MSNLIIHIGMPKTGSSSIQKYLFDKQTFNDFIYTPLGMANQGGVMLSVFSENPFVWHGHKEENRNQSQVKDFNDFYTQKLERAFASHKNQVVSGEDIFHMDQEGLKNLNNFCRKFFDKVTIIGYVRSPISFMESAFVQLVKNHDLSSLDFELLWPNYRAKLEKFDNVFGLENVKLRHFSSDSLHKGDVVIDFLSHLGVFPESIEMEKVNESLSIEAVSCLFVYRNKTDKQEFYPGIQKDKLRLIELLSKFGNKKLKFSSQLTSNILYDKKSDLDWINARLNKDILDLNKENEFSLDSVSDIYNIAYSALPDLESYIRSILQASAFSDLSPVLNYVEEIKLNALKKSISDSTNSTTKEIKFFTQDQYEMLTDDVIGPAIFLREFALSFERLNRIDEAKKCINAALELKPEAIGLLQIKQRLITN